MSKSNEINREELVEIICYIADKIINNSSKLTRLDSKVGDSDHGDNMKRGFQAVKNSKSQLEEKMSLKEVLEETGEIITFNVGGSAGPLFGKLFSEFASSWDQDSMVTRNMLPEALNNSLTAIKDLGGAEPGDKTMVDTLQPVVDYLQEITPQDFSCQELWENIKKEAHRGLESTRDISAKKGRARYLNDRSKGHLDPGAYSCYLIFAAVAEYYNSQREV